MSYCRILVGGKERGLKFLQMAAVEMYKLIDEKVSVSANYAMVYGGLLCNYYVKREEFGDWEGEGESKVFVPITFEKVCEWTDELTEEDWQKINEAWAASEIYKKTDAYKKEQEEAAKKNETQTAPITTESA